MTSPQLSKHFINVDDIYIFFSISADEYIFHLSHIDQLYSFRAESKSERYQSLWCGSDYLLCCNLFSWGGWGATLQSAIQRDSNKMSNSIPLSCTRYWKRCGPFNMIPNQSSPKHREYKNSLLQTALNKLNIVTCRFSVPKQQAECSSFS